MFTIHGWMICDFTSNSTVFQSYQDDGRVNIKSSVQLSAVYVRTKSSVQRYSNPRPRDPKSGALNARPRNRFSSQFKLHASNFILHSSDFTLYTSDFTVHTSQFIVHTSQFTGHTLHCIIRTLQFIV